jgi:undecaprenyl-diphosphatase
MSTLILRLHLHDERVLHALLLRRRPRLDRAMRALTHLGDAAVTVLLALFLALGLVPGTGADGGGAAFALVGSHLLVQLVKRTVSRPRPRLPVGIAALAHAPDRFSFPSGHAASSLSVALAVAAPLPAPAAAGVLATAAVVGISRCYLGVHYPGDVAAGWALAGLGTAAAATLL